MHLSHSNYLPLSLPSFSILAGALLLLILLIAVRVLRHAYMSLGISAQAATLLLLASLFGSYINIPVAQLPREQIVAAREFDYFGMRYLMPVEVEWPGTIVAVNLGGAVIPVLLSLYLLAKRRAWIPGIIVTAIMTLVCHYLARPVPGVGITIPIFVPPAAAAITALVVWRREAAPLAYVGGSIGTLIGADLLNLDRVHGLGAPVVSIGGAGTFDGIFVTGVLAVLIAGFAGRPTRGA
jgi:uncharacterized membrane protein